MRDNKSDQYSERETEQRREAALKRMLSTPHKPHKPLGNTRPRDGADNKKKKLKD
jgi:hypothetical protein